MNLARDTARQIAQQIECRAADMVEFDILFERRVRAVPFEHGACIAHRGACKRAHRTGRNRVDANPVMPEIGGEIAHTGLQRRLGHPHHIVVRHHAAGAKIGQRDHRAAAEAKIGGHQPRRALRNGGEGVTGNAERATEIGPRGIDVTALQFVAVGMGNGVNQEIEAAPFALQGVERGIEFVIILDIARQHDLRPDGSGKRFQPAGLRFALIGEGDFGTGARQIARNTPGDRVVVGDPHHQTAFSAHQIRGFSHSCLTGDVSKQHRPESGLCRTSLCGAYAA